MQHSAQERPNVTTQVEAMASGVPSVTMTEPGIDEKRLLRRIDLRVMPMLFLIYLAAFLDR
jgi:hypothetical protein